MVYHTDDRTWRFKHFATRSNPLIHFRISKWYFNLYILYFFSEVKRVRNTVRSLQIESRLCVPCLYKCARRRERERERQNSKWHSVNFTHAHVMPATQRVYIYQSFDSPTLFICTHTYQHVLKFNGSRWELSRVKLVCVNLKRSNSSEIMIIHTDKERISP